MQSLITYDQAEVIFELTWQYARWHEQQSDNTQEKIMDELEGSRGIFSMIVAVSAELEEAFKKAPWGETDLDFYEEVDTRGVTMIATLAAKIL